MKKHEAPIYEVKVRYEFKGKESTYNILVKADSYLQLQSFLKDKIPTEDSSGIHEQRPKVVKESTFDGFFTLTEKPDEEARFYKLKGWVMGSDKYESFTTVVKAEQMVDALNFFEETYKQFGSLDSISKYKIREYVDISSQLTVFSQ